MKAWLVRERDEFSATVVFAETRGKARSLAMCTEACEGAKFIDIEVSRQPQMDKHYKEGKTEMDWDNPKDRVALVKDCGFICGDEYKEDCENCSAREFCDGYKYGKELEWD